MFELGIPKHVREMKEENMSYAQADAMRLCRGSTKVRYWLKMNWLRSLWINRHVPSASKQIESLGYFIMNEVPGEPSQSQGAVETAIRLLRTHVPGVSITREQFEPQKEN